MAEQPAGSGRELVGALVWLLAAVAAVLASFLSIQRLTVAPELDGVTGDDGGNLGRQVITSNGWGHVRVSTLVGDSLSSSGPGAPVYGVLFCGCAALLVVAAIWQLVPRWRTRWLSPAWPALAGALLLLGSAATLVSELYSYKAQSSGAGFKYQAGTGLYVVAASGVVALLPSLYRHWQTARVTSVRPAPVRQDPPSEAEPVQDLGSSAF